MGKSILSSRSKKKKFVANFKIGTTYKRDREKFLCFNIVDGIAKLTLVDNNMKRSDFYVIEVAMDDRKATTFIPIDP